MTLHPNTYPNYPYSPGYPDPVVPPTYPAPSTNNTTTINLPPREKNYSVKIFDDMDEANEFMDDVIVGDVRVVDLAEYKPVFIVFYEIEVAP